MRGVRRRGGRRNGRIDPPRGIARRVDFPKQIFSGKEASNKTDARVKPAHDASKPTYRFALRFLAGLPRFAVFFGTLCPAALASERPIAIACLRLVTFRPERPLFSVPALRSLIARETLADAFLEYFRAMIALSCCPDCEVRANAGHPFQTSESKAHR
jgi:hypothetical protein